MIQLLIQLPYFEHDLENFHKKYCAKCLENCEMCDKYKCLKFIKNVKSRKKLKFATYSEQRNYNEIEYTELIFSIKYWN